MAVKREVINPKVTIVSTLPFKLTESKPGMFPSYYEIEAAPTKDTLGITHISDAFYHELMPFGDTRAPLRRVDILAERVAQGLIQDYIQASLSVQMEILDNGSQRVPGLFWVNGVHTGGYIKSNHRDELEQCISNTVSWFEALVKLADDDWQKNRQHKMISDLQRRACTYLGLKDREWNVNILEIMSSVCWSCFTAVNPNAIKCATCSAILKEKEYEANKHRFAGA